RVASIISSSSASERKSCVMSAGYTKSVMSAPPILRARLLQNQIGVCLRPLAPLRASDEIEDLLLFGRPRGRRLRGSHFQLRLHARERRLGRLQVLRIGLAPGQPPIHLGELFHRRNAREQVERRLGL